MGDKRNKYMVLVRHGHVKDVAVDGSTILKWIFKKQDREV